MIKVMILSLFAYDFITRSLERNENFKRTDFQKEELEGKQEVEIDITKQIHESISKLVTKEIVDCAMFGLLKKEVDSVVLFLDKSDNSQEQACQQIREKLGESANIEIIKVNCNDVLAVAREVVRAIDSFGPKDEISIGIPSLKNPNALGLIYGSYTRSNRIKELFYIDREYKKALRMPKLSLELTKNQKKILQHLKSFQEGIVRFSKHKKVYDHFNLDKSSYYFILNMLREKGLIEDDHKLTEMGEIALL